jgi:nucleoside-diphosphate-sugar epimerase
MKILVTGAGGFVGRHALPALRTAFPQAEIIGCGSAADLTPLDLTDPGAVERLVRDTRPNGCLHLAAISAIPDARAAPERAWQVNVAGTLALARALLAHAPSCRLVFASSSEIYGTSFRSGLALDEHAVPAPQNVYAATKAAADLALGAMVPEGLRVVRVRPFNHTGPGQTANFVVPAFARQIGMIAAGTQEAVLRVGNLEPRRDFLDVRDVVRAYALCLRPELDLPPGLVLNLASGHPVRIGDVLDDLLALAGVTARIETDPALVRPVDIMRAWGDAAQARKVLGWGPQIAWRDTLRDISKDWQQRLAAGA